MTWQVRGSAMVERSTFKLKVQGSNPSWGSGPSIWQLFKPDPIDKLNPWWRSGRAFDCQAGGPGFDSWFIWSLSQVFKSLLVKLYVSKPPSVLQIST